MVSVNSRLLKDHWAYLLRTHLQWKQNQGPQDSREGQESNQFLQLRKKGPTGAKGKKQFAEGTVLAASYYSFQLIGCSHSRHLFGVYNRNKHRASMHTLRHTHRPSSSSPSPPCPPNHSPTGSGWGVEGKKMGFSTCSPPHSTCTVTHSSHD